MIEHYKKECTPLPSPKSAFTGLVTDKTLLLRRMGVFQRRLFARRMTCYTVFLCAQRKVNFVKGDIRSLFPGRRNKEEDSDDGACRQDQHQCVFHFTVPRDTSNRLKSGDIRTA